MAQTEVILRPIEKEFGECRNMYDSLLTHTNPLLSAVLTMVRCQGGKMMRPIMVLLSARLFGDVSVDAMRVAVGYECFHTASLIHDDVVDESDRRRGQESVNFHFGSKVAVLVGDYLLSTALSCISQTRRPELIEFLSQSASGLSDGELLQLHNVSKEDFSEEVYFDIIRKKTAALFASCAMSGAAVMGAGREDQANMYRFGELTGLCFQIRDDIFDYESDEIGKPTGNDMKEGKLTLPVLHAIHRDPTLIPLALSVKQGTASQEEIDSLVSSTKKLGGISYAETKMEALSTEARQILMTYPDTPVRQSLLAYLTYVTQRRY